MAKKSSKAKQPSAATKREPPFRLACVSCDRDDYDGVYRLPQNWTEIQKLQSLAESKKTSQIAVSSTGTLTPATAPNVKKLNADSARLRLIACHRSYFCFSKCLVKSP